MALTRAKATSEGVDLLSERLAARIKIETVDGKRVARIMQADGVTPMAGKGSAGATFDDLVGEARQKWPSLFQGSGSGGSGAPNRQGAADAKVISRKSFDALSPYEQASKVRAGIKIVD